VTFKKTVSFHREELVEAHNKAKEEKEEEEEEEDEFDWRNPWGNPEYKTYVWDDRLWANYFLCSAVVHLPQ
jgi:hypothetical protein